MSDPLPPLDVVSRRISTSISFPRRIAELAGKVMQIAIPTLMAGAGYFFGGAAGGVTALSLSVFLLMAPALLHRAPRKPPCTDSPVDVDDPETGYPMDFRYSPEPDRSSTPDVAEPRKIIRHDSDYWSEMAEGSRSPDYTDSEDD